LIARVFLSSSLVLLLQACGGELDIFGTWRNTDGDTLSITGRGPDDRIVARMSDRWDVLVREHPFGGVSLGFAEGQNVQGGGSAGGFITNGEISIFCSACTLGEGDDDGRSMLGMTAPPAEGPSVMRCDSKEIAVEQFGVKLDEAEFDCEWRRESRLEPMDSMERTR
jgi:hypothetical protein